MNVKLMLLRRDQGSRAMIVLLGCVPPWVHGQEKGLAKKCFALLQAANISKEINQALLLLQELEERSVAASLVGKDSSSRRHPDEAPRIYHLAAPCLHLGAGS